MEQDDMQNTTTNSLERIHKDPGLWQEIVQQARLVFLLFKDPEVPLILKLVPLAGLLYLLSPIDLIPGAVVPVIGGLDDVTALLVAAKVFIDLTPPHIVDKYTARLRGESTVPMSDKESRAWEDAIVLDAEYEPTEKSELD
jgi:uncharacterized membrane protein YkvA (DUF1232 family)